METLATPEGWTAPAPADAVSLPRRHVVVIAASICVPLPLFSLGAMVFPLPQLLERAAATFVALAAPEQRGRGLVREQAASRPLEIHYRAGERPGPARAAATSSNRTKTSNAAHALRRRTRPVAARSGLEGSSPERAAVDPQAAAIEQGAEPTPAPSSETAAPATPQLAPSTPATAPPTPKPPPAAQPGEGGQQPGPASGTDGRGPDQPGGHDQPNNQPGNGVTSEPGGGPQPPPSGQPAEHPGAGAGTSNGSPPESPPRKDQAPSPPGQGRP